MIHLIHYRSINSRDEIPQLTYPSPSLSFKLGKSSTTDWAMASLIWLFGLQRDKKNRSFFQWRVCHKEHSSHWCCTNNHVDSKWTYVCGILNLMLNMERLKFFYTLLGMFTSMPFVNKNYLQYTRLIRCCLQYSTWSLQKVRGTSRLEFVTITDVATVLGSSYSQFPATTGDKNTFSDHHLRTCTTSTLVQAKRRMLLNIADFTTVVVTIPKYSIYIYQNINKYSTI